MVNKIRLLDCTLRDGGYVNNWEWGVNTARDIIRLLTDSGLDIVEVGFLRNIDKFDEFITVANTIEELNTFLPKEKRKCMYSAMAMRSNYDVNKLSPYCGNGIEIVRITAHEYDIEEGIDFAAKVKELGYKVSLNPINIMGYSDAQILHIIERVNALHPWQFCIVDTFGSMGNHDLDRIVGLIDNNLARDIRLGLHLHENMSLGCSLAQRFVDKSIPRSISIDGSLMGMGRNPGNLPIELIADYLNKYRGTSYDIDYMMDAIHNYIARLKGETNWGYTPAYFLSARYNLHRNYAEHYLSKGDLTNRDINHILSGFDRLKCAVFDKEYADKKYNEYKNNSIDDKIAKKELEKLLRNQEILILAPGRTLKTYKSQIDNYIEQEKPVVISLNFTTSDFNCSYVFFGNNRRYQQFSATSLPIIATSNVNGQNITYNVNYNSLVLPSSLEGYHNNSLILLLRLLCEINITNVSVAGADGYQRDSDGGNYSADNMHDDTANIDKNFNIAVRSVIHGLPIKITFITPSEYGK